MYDINVKVIKKGKKFYLIFLLAGLFFFAIIGGIIFVNANKKAKMDATTMSKSVDVLSHNDDGTTMYSPVYYYEVNGVEYSCSSNSSSNIHPGNGNKKVYYNSKNPSECVTEYSSNTNKVLFFVLILPIAFIAIAIINMMKINKRVKKVEELNQKGKLVKNLPYHMEPTGMSVNNVPVMRPVVDYTLPSGSTIALRGDPRHDNKSFDADGMVDLVIDENNPDNYFIDFEINRLTGNVSSDFFQPTPTNTQGTVTTTAGQTMNQMNLANQYVNQNVANPQMSPEQMMQQEQLRQQQMVQNQMMQQQAMQQQMNQNQFPNQ